MRYVIVVFVLALILVSCNPTGNAVIDTSTHDNITIATFNLRAFGTSKANDKNDLGVIAKSMHNFDIIAVQEIRDESGKSVQKLLSAMNGLGGEKYSYVISERLGRSISKEQYAIFYDSKINFVNNTYQYPDNDNYFERPPFSAMFEYSKTFFVLMDIHTKPENATQEIHSLDNAVKETISYFNNSNIVILGDFNAGGSYYDRKNDNQCVSCSDYKWLIPDSADTTVAKSANAYDRILLYSKSRLQTSGDYGIYHFDRIEGLSAKQAVFVSDHYPVWVTLYVD